MKISLIALLLIVSIFTGCSKSNKKDTAPVDSTLKIEIVSGNHQTDTIGKRLTNLIYFKVLLNNNPVNGYTIQLVGSGCNSDHVDSVVTVLDGTNTYNWFLAGDVGTETLKAYVLNSKRQRVDSVTANATALAPGPGWHYSACGGQTGMLPSNYCILSTGRIFAVFTNGETYLRYSDDNGRSWNLVKSLGDMHELEYIVSTPQDELIAITYGEGNLYSADAGTTWTMLPKQPFNTDYVTSVVYTNEGKLLVSGQSNPISISSDKGNTWTIASPEQFVPPHSATDGNFSSPAEDIAGNLYLVGRYSQTIYKSSDNGATWTVVPHPEESDYGLYIDKNNWFYKSTSDNNGGIFISKDNGNTYSQLGYYSNYLFSNLSLQSDGKLYFDAQGQGLFQSTGSANNFAGLIYQDNLGNNLIPYIVAKNNNIIVTDLTYLKIRYYQNP
jgi:photosystem II stability/assembly factor-like uncharacterized protein